VGLSFPAAFLDHCRDHNDRKAWRSGIDAPNQIPKIALVGQEPRDGKLWKAGAKTKWNRVRSGRESEKFR